MRFPVTVRYRSFKARIYGRSPSYGYFRLAYVSGGRRLVRSFGTYTEARAAGERILRELARGDQGAALSPRESADALAVRQALVAYYAETGKRVTSLEAVTAYLSSARKLGDHNLDDAVRGFLQTVAVVKRKGLAEAVAEFVASRERKTVANGDRRSALSPIYVRGLRRILEDFAGALSGYAVADLTRENLTLYLEGLDNLAPKSRNHVRATLRAYFKWCVGMDYLPQTHRLGQVDAMKVEPDAPERIQCYTAGELKTWLEGTEGEIQAVVALQALAGIRLLEALRLDWADVFRTPGYIEIGAGIAKCRSRRLVPIRPSLEQWLAPFRGRKGKVWTLTPSVQGAINAMQRSREALKITPKKNGLRHGYISAAIALNPNEHLVAAECGTSAAMVHQHYRALMTASDATTWFAVAPAAPANVAPLHATEGAA